MSDWTEYLRRHGGFQSFGKDCMMNSANVFTDPYLTAIGNRVWIAGAWVAGHDASAVMMGEAYGERRDAVGPVIIGDDVFVGYDIKILPNTRIGNRVIIGAGSVVSGIVPDNSVFAGAPARLIRSLDEHLNRIRERTRAYPWNEIIAAREGGYDARTEPALRAARVAYFYPQV